MIICYPYEKEIKTIEQAQDAILHMCNNCGNTYECSGVEAALCNEMKEQIAKIFRGLDTSVEKRDWIRTPMRSDRVDDEKEDIYKREFLLVEIEETNTDFGYLEIHSFITDSSIDTAAYAMQKSEGQKDRASVFQSMIRENGYVIKDLGVHATNELRMIVPDLSSKDCR